MGRWRSIKTENLENQERRGRAEAEVASLEPHPPRHTEPIHRVQPVFAALALSSTTCLLGFSSQDFGTSPSRSADDLL